MTIYWLLMMLLISDASAAGTRELPNQPTVVQIANQNFIQVDGNGLKSKMDSAVRLGRSNARKGSFWVGYQFDVKPNVMIDGDYSNKKGERAARPVRTETNNVGVFFLYDNGGETISKVETFNLDRTHDYNGYPVYWLGRASNDESLNLLREMVEKETPEKLAEKATTVIALHNDSRIGQILENFVRNLKSEAVRKQAVFWLGQSEGETGFLADIIRNEQESVEVRKQAAFAIGISQDANAVTALQGLFDQVTEREVRKQIVFAAFVNHNHSDSAIEFLINAAGKDKDREVRKQAIFWLGQKAGQRTLEVLGNTVEQNDEDTEVQKQAVFAISQRKKDESVPMLIKIAKTHQKGEVRKQALFWLGQIDDERALEVFKEILSK
jgi:HEAT repeat protein